jgi:hypothetical protein
MRYGGWRAVPAGGMPIFSPDDTPVRGSERTGPGVTLIICMADK